MKIHMELSAQDLSASLESFWKTSGKKIKSIENSWDPKMGAPVFTIKGKYSSQGWTEWTQGFQFGSALLQFEATDEESFLQIGKNATEDLMAGHITHTGVHDHGFNNVSTYGNLLRMMKQGKIPSQKESILFYEMALKASSCVQAGRWTQLNESEGFIYSFNGPHSLFADTIRSLRVLAVGHQLGHFMMGENDKRTSLLDRLIQHALTTAKYTVYYGEGRDNYDVSGRVAHESVFNVNDGNYRCPNSQQGYSPFTTWTRGLAWVIAGYGEQLEYLDSLPEKELIDFGGKNEIESIYLNAAKASCDFYIENTPLDGIPYWDTGAPGLIHMGDYLNRNSEPLNDYEPIDSSSAAIASQGFLRLGTYLKQKGNSDWAKYWQAGLSIVKGLLTDVYISEDENHQGLLLHSIYHRPNNWDYIPEGSKIPQGEACMWGDYHMREVALYLNKIIKSEGYYTFYTS